MAHLNYLAITSLDGYIEDVDGNFDWGEPDEEVHSFINDLVSSAGTFLYGRRMYEIMTVWETDPNLAAVSPYREFAEIWQAVSTRKTRLERNFDPEKIRELKAATGQDLLIGGPDLAAHAFRAGLIDACQLFLGPVILGSGKPALQNDIRLELELLEERRFGNGMVYLHYQVRH